MTTVAISGPASNRAEKPENLFAKRAGQGIDFAQIFQRSPIAQAIVDAQYRVCLANPAFSNSLGVAYNELIGRDLRACFSAAECVQNTLSAALDCALNGDATSLPELCAPIRTHPHLDTSPQDRWWSVDCTPLPQNPQLGPTCLLRLDDITARVTIRQKQDAFGNEVRHRIGNVLSLVQIIARNSAPSTPDLDAFLAGYDSRVRALGKTHSILSGANWNGMTLREVIDGQLDSENIDSAGTITCDGPDWHLSVLHAQTFAMAVHELLSNAQQHGALQAKGGQIDVTWDNTPDGSYSFLWRETGLSGLTVPERTGFGLQMINTILPEQLGGKGVCTFAPQGFQFMLAVPHTVAVPVGQKPGYP